MAILGVLPPPSPKNLGIPRKMYEKERDIIPFKEKFGKKGIKTKNLLFFEKFVKWKCNKKLKYGYMEVFRGAEGAAKIFGG